MPNDDPRLLTHHLILDGDVLQDANNKDPGEDEFVAWMGRVRAFLTSHCGADHPFLAEAEKAALGPVKLRRPSGERPIRYFHVRIIGVSRVLRRVQFDLQSRAHAEQAPRVTTV